MTQPRRFPPVRTALTLGALAALLLVAPTAASSAQVTHGAFHQFAAGSTQGLEISGHAVMVRANGRTHVVANVSGLSTNTAYAVHVHKQACSATDPVTGLPTFADGHYQFVPGTGSAYVNAVNEIWPGFTTNAAGIGHGFAQNDGIAGPTAVSVVVHAPGSAKIACADLS